MGYMVAEVRKESMSRRVSWKVAGTAAAITAGVSAFLGAHAAAQLDSDGDGGQNAQRGIDPDRGSHTQVLQKPAIESTTIPGTDIPKPAMTQTPRIETPTSTQTATAEKTVSPTAPEAATPVFFVKLKELVVTSGDSDLKEEALRTIDKYVRVYEETGR